MHQDTVQPIEIVGEDTDTRVVPCSLKDNIKPVELEFKEGYRYSKKLAHVTKIYEYTTSADSTSIEHRVFIASKAIISQTLEQLSDKDNLDEAVNYITGILKGFEDRLNDQSLPLRVILTLDTVIRYLSNNPQVKRLIALREDRLFKALNTATFTKLDKDIGGIDWSKLAVEGKGLSVVKHASGEAVGYYNGKVVGVRLVDGRYKINNKNLPTAARAQLKKSLEVEGVQHAIK